MKESNLVTRLNALMIDLEAISKEELTFNASWDDLGMDELDKIFVLQAVEREFGITIPDEAAGNLSEYGELVAYVEKYAEN